MAKNAELLVVRHETRSCAGPAGRVQYEPADRVWFAALGTATTRAGAGPSLPVTPATLLAWHRRLAGLPQMVGKRSRK